MMTLTEENYLKALHRLSQTDEAITVKRIALQLGIKMPTVTSMVKNLAGKKLIRYEKYKAIQLTDKGRRQAFLQAFGTQDPFAAREPRPLRRGPRRL